MFTFEEHNLHILCLPDTGSRTVRFNGLSVTSTYGESDSPSGYYIKRTAIHLRNDSQLVSGDKCALHVHGFLLKSCIIECLKISSTYTQHQTVCDVSDMVARREALH